MKGGYRGFYSRNMIPLTPKVVNNIHKRGGTILGTSRGGNDPSKIVDSIQDRGINQVYLSSIIVEQCYIFEFNFTTCICWNS